MFDRRGQSETLGFVLVFGLMVSSIGIVYVAGFSGLQDVRDAERVTNAERAFEVLADNVEDITQRGAPSRATEIKLADARLYVGDTVEVQVNVPDGGFNETYQVRPLVYDAGTGTTIVYEQGAVIRMDGDDGIVRHESVFLLNGSRTVLPVVAMRSAESDGIAGSTTVLVRTDHSQTVLDYRNETRNKVWVNVTSPRADAWRAHLNKSGEVHCESVADDTAPCQLTTESLTVTIVRINLALE